MRRKRRRGKEEEGSEKEEEFRRAKICNELGTRKLLVLNEQ